MIEPLPGAQAFTELLEQRTAWFTHVSRPIQLPEPGLVLDLASRRGSEVRTMKHLQQMCTLHRENFALASQIKHLYLVDAFIELAAAENALALFSVARSMLELNAVLHEVQQRLAVTAQALTPNNWIPVGEKFFGLIVRARYSTSNPELREVLIAETGVSAKRLDPFNITNCVAGLAEEMGHEDAVARYAVLCDSVHHNLGSMTKANSGSGLADAAVATGGGMIISSGPMPVTQYEYPVAGQGGRALEQLAPGFLSDARDCVRWLNDTPASPFSPDLVRSITGNELGFEFLGGPRS